MATKTHEQFMIDFYNRNPKAENIEILEKYKGATTKIKCRCKIDGYEWYMRPNNLLNGQGCPMCGGSLRISQEEFVERVSSQNKNIKIIGTYVNGKQHIEAYCAKHDVTWKAIPSQLMLGFGCPECRKEHHRISHEEFEENFRKRNSNSSHIKLISEYLGSDKNIKCLCTIHNHEWEVEARHLYKNHNCPICNAEKRKTHDEFMCELKSQNPHFDDIEVLTEYKDCKTKIDCRCKIDGYEWSSNPNDLLRGHGCAKCAGIIKKTHEEFISELEKINPNIEALERYSSRDTKILCKCKIDGNTWYATPKTLLRGHGCPTCSKRHLSELKTKCHADYEKELAHKNPKMKMLSEYKNSSEKILVQCQECNHEWWVSPTNLLNGSNCPECSKRLQSQNIAKTHSEYVEDLYKVNPNIDVIGEYKGSRKKIRCKCKIDGYEWNVVADTLLHGHGCPKCYERSRTSGIYAKTHEAFIEKFNTENPHAKDIEILGRYKNSKTKILCKCKIHNYEWSTFPSTLYKAKGCPVCTNYRVVAGLNDIATIRPDLVKYFIDPNDATKYTKSSNQRLTFKCPDCGYEKEMTIGCLSYDGFACNMCSDGFTYPNKYGYVFLHQLPIENHIKEYSPDWIKPRRYDNYFEYQGQAYILEMDGDFHFTNSNSYKLDYMEVQKTDRYKDKKAEEHNINMIRINCEKAKYNPDVIKNNILDSELSKIFDLSNIDWEKCDYDATSSLVKKVWDFANEHPDYPIPQISKEIGLGRTAVRKYIEKGVKMGQCNYNKCYQVKKVNVYKDGEFLHQYNSCLECAREMEKIYNLKFSSTSIGSVCKGKYKHSHGFVFEYAD